METRPDSDLGRPARGLVLGKFMPPHGGHQFLCDFARAYCEQLTILVCSLQDDPIPGELRLRWMRELYPDCRVVHLDEDVPQAPEDHPAFWPIWRDLVRRFHPEALDVVFASESYGHRLARELSARFVPVDPDRVTRPVSASAVRADPFGQWRFIPPAVRPYFVRRVCVFGPESTGKTTLANRLAERFLTLVAPEYGRIYTEAFGTECSAGDLRKIVQGHLAGETAAARQSNRILICDTDPVLTGVWSEMLTGVRDPWFTAYDRLCDLYLLTDVDLVWVDDGTRYFEDQPTRNRFFGLCLAELEARGARFVRLRGDYERRYTDAVAAITSTFPGLEAQDDAEPARRPLSLAPK